MSDELLTVTRAQLSAFLKDPRAIRAFEKAIRMANVDLPSRDNEISIAADSATARAEQALAELAAVIEKLDTVALAPTQDIAAQLSRIADALELLAYAPPGQDSNADAIESVQVQQAAESAIEIRQEAVQSDESPSLPVWIPQQTDKYNRVMAWLSTHT